MTFGAEPIEVFLCEERIEPEQIGDTKVALHKRFLRDWVARRGTIGQLSWEEIWKVREECIAALSE